MSNAASSLDPLLFILGVVLALISTLFFNTAPLIQKQGLSQLPGLAGKPFFSSMKKMFLNRKWLWGFLIMNIGGLFYIVAVGFSSAAIVEPLLNFGFIVLPWMAKRMLGEKVDKSGKLGISMLIIMPVFIAMGGLSTPSVGTPWFYGSIVVFTAIDIVIAAISIIAAKRAPISWALAAGTMQGLAAVYLQWFSTIFFPAPDLWLGFIAGLVPLLISLVVNIAGAMYLPSIALQNNPASKVGPIVGTLSTTVAIAGGILVFTQAVGNVVFYAIGLCLAITGVFLLKKYHVIVNPVEAS
ncbi:MAG TPA: DMT family transporter [Candidatus Lokiarchaeia archaeon]|nr:DMT family transporter [Candidatus Lokiarchaeia archaeon]